MLFSVIVPIYNAEATLRPCIESVLHQTCGEFELILVDDGSEDGSSPICEQFSRMDGRVQVIHQENQGHTAARNAGLRASKGDYILFLDSDDWYENNLLEVCKGEAESAAPDLILFGHNECHGKKRNPVDLAPLRGRYGCMQRSNPLFRRLIMAQDGQALPRALWGKAFQRSLICKWLPQIPPEIITGEDLCCFLAAALEARTISVLAGTYYNYRVLPGSLSRKSDPHALKRCWYTMDFLSRAVPSGDEAVQAQLSRLVVQQMYSALLRSVRSQAKRGAIHKDMFHLRSHPLCRAALEQAQFSAPGLNVKKWIVRHELLGAVKLIDLAAHPS